jgi:hypothetical protein
VRKPCSPSFVVSSRLFNVVITLSICFLLSNLVRSVRRFPTASPLAKPLPCGRPRGQFPRMVYELVRSFASRRKRSAPLAASFRFKAMMIGKAALLAGHSRSAVAGKFPMFVFARRGYATVRQVAVAGHHWSPSLHSALLPGARRSFSKFAPMRYRSEASH